LEIIVRQIQYGTREYDEELMLRTKILREPLGLTFTAEQLKAEEQEYHLGAFWGEKLVGCLILKPDSDKLVQMRQVAVAADLQGKGIGREMVLFAEKFIVNKGYTRIILHAREVVVSFYEKLGYRCEGDIFIEVTIPHRTMIKEIAG
jgi:predicted GNAT family N-acyltransferase